MCFPRDSVGPTLFGALGMITQETDTKESRGQREEREEEEEESLSPETKTFRRCRRPR